MKKVVKKALYILLSLVVLIFIFGLIVAFLPTKSKTNHRGISTEEATLLRQKYTQAHQTFTTTDGEMLFLRRWNPDSLVGMLKNSDCQKPKA